MGQIQIQFHEELWLWGQTIVEQGSPGNSLLIVRKGVVLTLATLNIMAIFGQNIP